MDLIPITTAAERVGRDPSVVRRVCLDEGIGTLVTPRLRLLTPDDLAHLERIFAGRKRGGPRPGSGRPRSTA